MNKVNGSQRRARLGERSERVLDFLIEFKQKRGMAPTYREIGQACEISTTSLVDYHLEVLARAGFIRRYPGVARGIVILEGSDGASPNAS